MGTLSEEVRTEVLCGRICDLEAENAKLRELVSNYAAMTEYLLARQPLLFPDKASELQELDEKRRELGIEVDS